MLLVMENEEHRGEDCVCCILTQILYLETTSRLTSIAHIFMVAQRITTFNSLGCVLTRSIRTN